MSDVKNRLHGGVEERKKQGALRLKRVLDEIKRRGVVSDKELSSSTGIDKKELGRYTSYLKDKGIIKVKKKFLGKTEYSISGGAVLKSHEHKEPHAPTPSPDPGIPSDPSGEPETPSDGQQTPPTSGGAQGTAAASPETPATAEPIPATEPVQSAPDTTPPEPPPIPQPESQPTPAATPEPAPSPTPESEQEPAAETPETSSSSSQEISPSTSESPTPTEHPTSPPEHSEPEPSPTTPEIPVESGTPTPETGFSTSQEPSESGQEAPPTTTAETPAEEPTAGDVGKPETSAVSGTGSQGGSEPEPARQDGDKGRDSSKMVVSGDKVMPETEEEFRNVCKSLATEFVGAMRLYAELDDQAYTAGLLIDKGEIVAASFEHMDQAEVTFGDEALSEIQTEFVGTKGDLEIFEMTEDDLNESVRTNINYMLSKPVKLSTLKIKIKSRLRPEPGEKEKKSVMSGLKSVFSGGSDAAKEERRKMLKEKRKVKKIGGGFNLIDFARNLNLDPVKAQRYAELRKTKDGGAGTGEKQVDERKSARLEELKMQRSGGGSSPISSAGDILAKEKRKDEIRRLRDAPKITLGKDGKGFNKRVEEGKKIHTNIDLLYEMVESKGRLKINEALAKKMKVSKTQIEAWAMILEEHNLLELRYPTIGEPEIISIHSDKSTKEGSDGKGKK
ncbi:MAG: DUF2226 domain-containing protein [Candidatus Altiarchaeales archaeon]|nr:DUF2226 domain-containing protein [Candidatus Altiarchaeales archaeon]MBD3416828.1 DUF2226 domain-containing protein [Candidatus Altiarchaeales archaeon]